MHNAKTYEIESSTILNESCSFLNIFQSNFIPNYRGVILDLLFSPVKTSVIQANPLILPADRNHPSFEFYISYQDDSTEHLASENCYFYDFKSCDYESFNAYLSSFEWSDLFLNKSTHEMLDAFYKVMHEGIMQFVPKRKSPKASKFPEWYSSELKNSIFLKKIAHRDYKITQNSSLMNSVN